MTEAEAVEKMVNQTMERFGHNVNCVLPGTIDTPPHRRDTPNADYNRRVQPEAIANVVQSLASDASRGINGDSIPIYGRS